MAKAHKMTRGVATRRREEREEKKLPKGVHFVDDHGNLFGSLGISRVEPRYYNAEMLQDAWRWGQLAEDQVKTLAEAL